MASGSSIVGTSTERAILQRVIGRPQSHCVRRLQSAQPHRDVIGENELGCAGSAGGTEDRSHVNGTVQLGRRSRVLQAREPEQAVLSNGFPFVSAERVLGEWEVRNNRM